MLTPLDELLVPGHASNMAIKVDHLLKDALALPGKPAAAPRRLLDLAGRGVGIWGPDSAAALERQRDEWR
jgi:hypothetical protein